MYALLVSALETRAHVEALLDAGGEAALETLHEGAAREEQGAVRDSVAALLHALRRHPQHPANEVPSSA